MSDRFDHTLEHRLESKPADGADGAVARVRGIELITGTGRRRQWSEEDKARVVVESLEPGANVSEVARRHGLSPQQLFGWRRQARQLSNESAREAAKAGFAGPGPLRCPRPRRGSAKLGGRWPGSEPAFAPVAIASATSSPASTAPPLPLAETAMPGLIEVVIGDAIVRVRGQIETGLIVAVLRAVRRAS
jgi:transposase-like protein